MAKLLVVNQGDSTLSIVDPETCKQVAKVPQTEICGHEVIASPDSKLAYVPIYSNVGVGETGTDGRIIEVIDLEKRQRVDIMDLGRPVRPHCALFGQDGLLYVTAELDNAVDAIDPHHRRVAESLPTGKT